MNCREIEHILKEAVSGEISPEQQQILEQHLSQCAGCAKEYASLLQTIEITTKITAPELTQHEWQVFGNNLKREINRRKSSTKSSIPYPARRKLIPALAVAVVVIAIAVIAFNVIVPKQPTVLEQSDLWIAIQDELISEFDLEDIYAFDNGNSDLEDQLEDLDWLL